MKTFYLSTACLFFICFNLFTGCKKDTGETMTEKEFERALKRNFPGTWLLDNTDNAHHTANAKCELLEGKIETSFTFDSDNTYFINYDSIINGGQYHISEQGYYSINHANKVITFQPVKTEKYISGDGSGNTTQLLMRSNHTLLIRFLGKDQLYLDHSYSKSVVVTNDAGVEVPEMQTITETVYFRGGKNC